MPNDPKRRVNVTEGLIVGGLAVVGLITGQTPLASLATGIAGSLAANLTEQGIRQWRENWPTDRGMLNQDIAKALLIAFKNAVNVLEHEWKQHPHFLVLQQTSPDVAQQTLSPFRWLREDATSFFQQPEHIASALQFSNISALLNRDENYARDLVAETLEQYLYGHDAVLITFLKEQLADEWTLQFDMVLHDPGKEGTRAWRNHQRLWQASLKASLEQLKFNSTQTQATIDELRKWAQRLDQPLRDSTGEDALKEALHPVYTRLYEIKANLEHMKHVQKRVNNFNVNKGNQALVQSEITGGTFTFNFPVEKPQEK